MGFGLALAFSKGCIKYIHPPILLDTGIEKGSPGTILPFCWKSCRLRRQEHTPAGSGRASSWQRFYYIDRFYYKPAASVGLPKCPAALAESAGQITALVLQISAAQDSEEGKGKGGPSLSAKMMS